MSINAWQLRELIGGVLIGADMHSKDAVELLMLTAAVESDCGTYIKQLSGPARGIFQMEPKTEKDLWLNYLDYRPDKTEIIKRYDTSDKDDLWWNLGYQILLCRVHYLRVPRKLPFRKDVNAMATYWKKHYNTHLGLGTTQKAFDKYYRYCT